MPYSLDSFHFNPRKAAQIFQQLRKERNLSQSCLASRTGISYDTIGNILSGKVQSITFENVFKLCVVMEIPIEVYMLMMLKDENIDFEDQILMYNTHEDNVTPVSDIDTSQVPSPVSETVAAVAEAVAAAESVPVPVHTAADFPCTGYSREEVSLLLDRMERLHIRQISELQANQEKTYKLLEMMIESNRS